MTSHFAPQRRWRGYFIIDLPLVIYFSLSITVMGIFVILPLGTPFVFLDGEPNFQFVAAAE